MFKGKDVNVYFVGEAEIVYLGLKKKIDEEILKGIESSFNQTLFKAISQKISFLKNDPMSGIHIPKNKIPFEYILEFETNNIWKINLPNGWRMIYTLKGKDVEILCIIMDLFDHRNYEKKFRYKKS